MKNPKDLNEVLSHHLKGGEFKYKSFDYKLALADFTKSEEYKNSHASFKNLFPNSKVDKYEIPVEFRDKHAVIRNGKLRKIEFTPHGDIRRCYIGAHYSITFYDYNLTDLFLL